MRAALDARTQVGPEDIAAVAEAARRFIRTEVATHLNAEEIMKELASHQLGR